ncbi:transposon TX1 [Tanacetum coccineum]
MDCVRDNARVCNPDVSTRRETNYNRDNEKVRLGRVRSRGQYNGKQLGSNYTCGKRNSAISFMFFNFPEEWGMGRLWMIFKKYETVFDMFMVQRRLHNGQRYGFVRFKFVRDVERLLGQLQKIKIADEWLKVFVAYDRRRNGNMGASTGYKSYANWGNTSFSRGMDRNEGYTCNRDNRRFVDVVNGRNVSVNKKNDEKELNGTAFQSVVGEVKAMCFFIEASGLVRGTRSWRDRYKASRRIGGNGGDGKRKHGRRHIDLESHRRDLQLEVQKGLYKVESLSFKVSAGFLVFYVLVVLGKQVRFSFVSGFKKSDYLEYKGAQRDREAEGFQVSNDDAAVAQRRLEDKQIEERTNTDCLGNVAGRKKRRSKEAKLGNLLKYKAWLTRRSPTHSSTGKNHKINVIEEVRDIFTTNIQEVVKRRYEDDKVDEQMSDNGMQVNRGESDEDGDSGSEEGDPVSDDEDVGGKKVLDDEGLGAVASGEKHGGENVGYRYSGETKVVDTFEGEYDTSKVAEHGEIKKSLREDKEQLNENTTEEKDEGKNKIGRSVMKAFEVARKTGVKWLGENKKRVSDVYKEYHDVESESIGIFHFGKDKDCEGTDISKIT